MDLRVFAFYIFIKILRNTVLPLVFFFTSHHKLFTIAFPGIRANVQNYYAITHAYIFHFFSQLTQKDTIPNIFK